MATIKDVAKKAKVSITTVSRVLNQSSHTVNPQTKQRVLKVIEGLKYKPNILARGLLKKESLTICVIVPDISNSYYSEIAHEFDSGSFSRTVGNRLMSVWGRKREAM